MYQAVEAALSARCALLLALRRGPGYGQELVERVARLSEGRLRIPLPHAYLALKTLLRRRLVKRWDVVPGGARGARRRAYYRLTSKGALVAEAQRAALLGLAGTGSSPSSVQRSAMVDRLIEGNALNAFGSGLRRAMTRQRR